MEGVTKTYSTNDYSDARRGAQVKREQKVRGVSFSIAQNEIMGILGPSGAGKSSIFKMITMSMKRTGGKIELMGRDFGDHKATAE